MVAGPSIPYNCRSFSNSGKGQIIAIQATILPKPYRDAFANIFDAAPEVEWSEIEKVRGVVTLALPRRLS
jgi:hypothetical protein